VPLQFFLISPKQLLSAAADRMKTQAERAHLNLHVECSEDLPDVLADKSRLEQVLVNLIHNAVKIHKARGEVVLLAEAVDGGVRFAVQDTGVGIPNDDLTRIFDAFIRVDKSAQAVGTGLGLSIVNTLWKDIMGKFWAESEEGQGVRFIL